jgi:sirohydrochlorin cobaltochelatase
LSSAYLLVSHGSRDPRPQIAIAQLAQQLSQWLQRSSPSPNNIHHVGTAQLELGDKPLHVQIVEFARGCGANKVVICPLFLLPGVHVMEDIPAEVAIAKGEEGLEVVVMPFLGAGGDLADMFAQHRLTMPDRAILLAHGSRRAHGNDAVEQLAARLGVKNAYWSIEPSLTDRAIEYINSGATDIGILLYFLFAGGITDAISKSVEELMQKFPHVKFSLGEPIGDRPELVETIGKMLISSEN